MQALASAAHLQKCSSVCTRNCTLLILLSPLNGNARSTCTTLPRPERALPKRRPGPCAPWPAAVKEDSSPHTEQPERVPVGEKALLHRPQGACRAILVTQGIAAQPIVATEHALVIQIQTPAF